MRSVSTPRLPSFVGSSDQNFRPLVNVSGAQVLINLQNLSTVEIFPLNLIPLGKKVINLIIPFASRVHLFFSFLHYLHFSCRHHHHLSYPPASENSAHRLFSSQKWESETLNSRDPSRRRREKLVPILPIIPSSSSSCLNPPQGRIGG